MKTPLTPSERLARIKENIVRFPGARLAPGEPKGRPIAICGFGPSLTDTWKDIRGRAMTTSGAHDFLIARGIIPTYHVECDPRPHKVEFLRRSHPNVTYLINSQCHPEMFDVLRGRKVVMWHGFTDDDAVNQVALVDGLEPGARMIGGGTNVGMRAILVARELGFTEFDLHAMDCCYRGESQWAGEHFTQRHNTVLVEVEGKTFETSDLMMQSTDDFFFRTMNKLPGCRFRVHGGGLLEERLKIFNRDPVKATTPGWWRPVNFTVRDAPFKLRPTHWGWC